MPNCPGAKLSGAKLSWCQIVRVPNCPFLLSWCQIVRFSYLGAKLSVLLSWCQIVWCQIVLQSMKLCRKCVKYSGRTLLWCFFFFFHVLDSFNVIELISAFVWSLSLNLWNPHEMVLFLTSDKHKDLLIINRGGGCKTICTQIQQNMQTKQRKVEIFW